VSPGVPFQAVLLDVDGTLVDSVDAHARAWVAALREDGVEVSLKRMRGMIGMGGDRILPLVAGISAESARGRRVSERRAAHFLSRELPHLRPTRGSCALLDALRAWGGPIAVATSAKPDELRPLLEIVEATDLLGDAASADDVDASKPAPSVVETALARIRRTPGEAVLIGDTGYDIESGANAGVATVALRSGGWADADLAGAIAIYDDPADLLANALTSPLAAVLAPRGIGAGAGAD
jgi:HAD superfamily hydrolase (TIGR01509 family)